MGFEESVVRILNRLGQTAGTGFIVSRSGQVLTCTHVIEDAVPGEQIHLKLYPFNEDQLGRSRGSSTDTLAIVVSRTSTEAEDVALLQIINKGECGQDTNQRLRNQSLDFPALALGTSLNIDGRFLKTYGFPQAKPVDGLPAKCEVIGSTMDHGYKQISVRSNEISTGFSGAPVWDNETCAVSGMVVSLVSPTADPAQRQQDTSFFIPVEIIREACPLLIPSIASCPYRGFDSFLMADADNYFGRDHAISELLGRLRRQNIVTVLGVSGSGKSSLVCAGLHQGLCTNTNPELLHYRLLSIKPGTVPLASLLVALQADSRSILSASPNASNQSTVGDQDEVTTIETSSVLAMSTDAIERSLIQLLKSGTYVLVIDQLERIFIDCSDERAVNEFVQVLINLGHDYCKIVLSIRADFYGRVLKHSYLGPLVAASQPMTLTAMNKDELQAAIQGPAMKNHVAVEAVLVGALIGDVINRPGDLPFLEFTLSELWRRDASKGILTLAGYRSLKVTDAEGAFLTGVHSVVVNQAEKCWRDLSKDEQSAAKRIFLQLISSRSGDEFGFHPATDASRRAFLEDFDQATTDVAQKLAATFLLTASTDPSTNKPTIELAHEALIHGWVRLNDWIKEYSNYIAWYERHLLPYLRHWQDEQSEAKRRDLLLPSTMVAEAARWVGANKELLTGPPYNFIQASILADNRRRISARRRRGLAIVVALALLCSGISILYFKFKSSLDEAQDLHERGLTAFADHEMLSAEVLLARALSANDNRFVRLFTRGDDADIREHLLQARNRGAQSMWVQNPQGRVLAVSTDFKLVAVANNNEVALFSTATHSIIYRFPSQRGYPVAASFSHDQRFFAYAFGYKDKGEKTSGTTWSVEKDGAVHIWSIEAHVEEKIIPLAPIRPNAIQKQVSSIAFPPVNSSMLAFATEDGLIRVWNLRQKKEIAHLEGHSLPVWGLSFSPQNDILASASSDNTVRLWNLNSRSQIGNPITAHEDTVNSVVFSPSGELLASGSADGTVRVWNATTHQEIKRFSNHFGAITSVAFQPTGTLLVSACEDQYIRVLDLNSGNEILRLRSYEGPPQVVAFSSSGLILAGGGLGVADSLTVTSGWLRLWQVGNVPELTSIYAGDSPLSTVALTNDYIISGDADRHIKIWKRDGTLVRTITASSYIQSIALSRDTTLIASGEASGVEVWKLWKHNDLAPIFIRNVPQVYAISFDPNGNRLALGSDRKILICTITVPNGPNCDEFYHEGGRVFDIAFSPNGEQIATAGGDNSVRLWNSHTYTEMHRSTTHTKDVWSITYDMTGDIIASAGADRTIRIMSTSDLSELRAPLERHKGTVVGLAFTPDGTYLASCGLDYNVFLWEWRTGTNIDLGVDDRPVWWVTFSPDGKYLATVGLNREIRIWNMQALRGFRHASAATLVRQSQEHTGLTLIDGQVVPVNGKVTSE